MALNEPSTRPNDPSMTLDCDPWPRPQELDDAARRRLQKRLMIPLPDRAARRTMLDKGLFGIEGGYDLSEDDLNAIVTETDGYSGSDMAGLCREAAMEPLRDEETMARLMAAGAGHRGGLTRAHSAWRRDEEP